MGWPRIYEFGTAAGPVHTVFAWLPTRLWYGRWVWLRKVQRARIIKRSYLGGPDWEFWSYDLPKQEAP